MLGLAVSLQIFASQAFGSPVDVDGAPERLADLGVVRADGSWRVVAVRTAQRDATLTGWSEHGFSATAGPGRPEATWLREALLDRQIVDLEGRRVVRVGDIVLEEREGRLEVGAVEVGLAALLRRLGLVRLARRLEPKLLAIDRLHLSGEAAGALVLDASRARLEELDEATATSLLSRLPVQAAERAVRTSRHRRAVAAQAHRRRRHRRSPRSPR
jgi:hypothetical protein